ncbi:hypothetical protein ACTXT7_015499 [Hymenolepis weldensis]
MKRRAVIVSLKAGRSNSDISRILKVATSFLSEVRKELLNKNNANELAATSKRKQYCQRSADSLSTPEFVRRVRGMINQNPDECICIYIIVKPSWRNTEPNGGRPLYVFQQDLAPSHKALEIQDSMTQNFHHRVTSDFL